MALTMVVPLAERTVLSTAAMKELQMAASKEKTTLADLVPTLAGS